jgi:ATP-binding protein involved in chromosome partitioning
MTSADLVREAISAVIDPELRRALGELGMVGSVSVAGGSASVEVRLTIAACPKRDTIEAAVATAAMSVGGVTDVHVEFGVLSNEERAALTARLHSGRTPAERFGADSLTRVIGVTSGKGGVGKSTIAANLAVELAQRGQRVGLLDIDVHGFSIPGLLGIADEKPTKVGDMILPPRAFDVPVISIGMFVDPHTPVSWRGPMLHRTVNQFLSDVHFGDLDVLICDLPPGTGDVAMSFGQLLPTADIVVVTTPQQSASDVAERSGLIARQLGQRVIGVVENMTDWVDTDGVAHTMFGSGGGDEVANRLGVPLLGSIPLTPIVTRSSDRGEPFVLDEPHGPAATAVGAIADALLDAAIPRGGKSFPLRIG